MDGTISYGYFSKLSKAVKSSLLDLPRSQLDPNIWMSDGELPTLRPDFKKFLVQSWEHGVQAVLSRSAAPWMKRIIFLGGTASYQWRESSDIDINIVVDFPAFRRIYTDFASVDEARDYLIQLGHKVNASGVYWQQHPVNFFIQEPDVFRPVTDAAYDVLEDCWLIPPLVLPEDFDPKKYFAPYLKVAESWMNKFDEVIMSLRRSVIDYKNNQEMREDPYLSQDKELLEKRHTEICDEVTLHLKRLLMWFEELHERRSDLYKKLREQEEAKPFARFQEPEVVWKYLEKYGYLDLLVSLKTSLPEELPECLSESEVALVESVVHKSI